MADETAPEPRRSRLPGREFWTRILYGIICIAIVICLVFIYFLGMQLRYEYQATNYVAKGQFLDAADRYLKAHDEAAWGKDRYLYLVGVNYLYGNEHIRAMDFFVRLNNLYPDSPWVPAATQYVDRVMDKLDPTRFPVEALRTNTQLGLARAHLQASYKRVMLALKENKAGVSNQLTIEYDAYKKYYESYKNKLVQAHKAVAAGTHPEKLDQL